MPGDNLGVVPVGEAVDFPQDGPSTSTDIARDPSGGFRLDTAGVYRVTFQVPIDEAGRLVVALNATGLAYTTTGRSTGTVAIGLTTLVHAAAADVLTIRNPTGSSSALTVSQSTAGGYSTASLLIELVKAD
jgi:hypothetical protein